MLQLRNKLLALTAFVLISLSLPRWRRPPAAAPAPAAWIDRLAAAWT